MKRTYDGLEDLLNATSREIVASIPPQYAIELNVIFFPQIGFLIRVPSNSQTGRADYEGGQSHDDAWEMMFSTEHSVYFKDFRTRELDETLGDMYADICG